MRSAAGGLSHFPPAKLAGRDRDLENFELLLQRLGDGRHERSLIFSGLRGVGKTVLLLEFEIMASEAKWVSTGVQEVGSHSDFRTSMARLALRLLRSMSLRQRMRDRARAAFSVVKSFSIPGPGGIRVQLDVDPAAGTADTGDIEQDLDTASLSALCMAYHRMSQQDLPVALVGAGLPTLPVMLRGAKPYAPACSPTPIWGGCPPQRRERCWSAPPHCRELSTTRTRSSSSSPSPAGILLPAGIRAGAVGRGGGVARYAGRRGGGQRARRRQP